jgi:hypothetical protein
MSFLYAVYWAKGNKNGYMPAKLFDQYLNRAYKKYFLNKFRISDIS